MFGNRKQKKEEIYQLREEVHALRWRVKLVMESISSLRELIQLEHMPCDGLKYPVRYVVAALLDELGYTIARKPPETTTLVTLKKTDNPPR